RFRINQVWLSLVTTFIVTSNDFFTLLVFGDHRFLSQCLALLSKINVLAGYRIIFFQRNTIWVISAILTGDVSVASASSRLHFDHGAQARFACQFKSSTRLAMSTEMTESSPRASIALMPRADTFRVTLRPNDGTK